MIPRKIFWLIDAVIVATSMVAAHWLTVALLLHRGALARVGALLPASTQPQLGALPPLLEFSWLIPATVPVVVFTLSELDAYKGLRLISRTRVALAGPIAMSSALGVAALVLFALRIHDWSRLFLFSFAAIGALGLSGVRVAVVSYYRYRLARGHYVHNVLAIARPELLTAIESFVLSGQVGAGARLMGYLGAVRRSRSVVAVGATSGLRRGTAFVAGGAVLATATASRPRSFATEPVPHFGAIDAIDRVLVRRPVHEVLVALDGDHAALLERVLAACDSVGVPVRLIPELLLCRRLPNLRWVNQPVADGPPGILLAPRDWTTEALLLKRLIDVVVSAVLLAALAPLFAMLAALVRLSGPGPIFYRWHVVGQNGKDFVGYKFRTMRPDADALKATLGQFNEMKGPVFKMTHDPRITPIGRWLRKFSLDELPQLFSVLIGDMSLVGPRPAGLNELPRYEFWQMRKLSIRPGMTCLWQVRGRNAITSFEDWVRMDLEYIDRWSFWLDVKILCWTVAAVLKGTGR